MERAWETVMNVMVKVTMLLGLAATCAGGQAAAGQSDSAGVQQAICFERAKAAAAAREAHREANGAGEAAQTKGAASARDSEVSGNGGERAATRFERAKNAAGPRQ